jgi:imidazolonepropionase-like amidohydrolase
VEPKKPNKEPAKERLLGLIRKAEVLRLAVEREEDVRLALKLADEFGVRMILEGLQLPGESVNALKSRGIPLIPGPLADTDGTVSPDPRRSADWPLPLVRTGARVAFGSFSQEPAGSRFLRLQAAAAIAAGVSPDQALRAITVDAAKTLGIADKVGSIGKGLQADLAVFAGDPLNPGTPVRMVISGGRIVHDRPEVKPAAAVVASASPTVTLPERLPERYWIKSTRIWDGTRFAPAAFAVEKGRIIERDGRPAAEPLDPVYDLGDMPVSPAPMATMIAAAPAAPGGLQLPPNLPPQLAALLAQRGGSVEEASAGYSRMVDQFDQESAPIRARIREAGLLQALMLPSGRELDGAAPGAVRMTDGVPLATALGPCFSLVDEGRNASRYPSSLSGQIEAIERFLTGSGPEIRLVMPDDLRTRLDADRRRLVQDALPVGNAAPLKPTFFLTRSVAEVDAALELSRRFKLRPVLAGVTELAPRLAEIKAAGAAVLVPPVTSATARPTLESIAGAVRSGIRVGIIDAIPDSVRQTLPLLMSAGLTEAEADQVLFDHVPAAIASGDPAAWRRDFARLERGSPATFVVWNGPPRDYRSQPKLRVAEGRIVAAP